MTEREGGDASVGALPLSNSSGKRTACYKVYNGQKRNKRVDEPLFLLGCLTCYNRSKRLVPAAISIKVCDVGMWCTCHQDTRTSLRVVFSARNIAEIGAV